MTSLHRIDPIRRRLAPLREKLLKHPLYRKIERLEQLQTFMQHHIFAVWDFMTLLKALQRHFCGAETLWTPPPHRLAARLVNEIVLGEESDEDGRGGFASHFELYHRAMQQCQADTAAIDRFVETIRRGESVETALTIGEAPAAAQTFVLQTLQTIECGDVCAIAAAFTFGREDLLPELFQRIVDELNVEGQLEDFRFYLARHIELDGDHHGPLAARLIGSLCGDDETQWRTVEEAATEALTARLALWDGMCETM